VVARSPDVPPTGAAADSERIGLVWMDAERALIAYWRDEPVVERIESGVPPKRTAVGSVRRGPARPASGSHRAAHRTEGRHVELMRRYLADLAERLADLDQVEVSGRGQPHARFAELLERLGAQAGGSLVVTTRSTARRPTEPQLIARLRKLADQELPRRTSGPYRDPLPDPEASRPARPAAARRNPRPRRLPERREIDLEVEMMLADEPQPTDEP
jgi:hypothetical protein